jgi:hypothetical protein
MIRRGAGSDVLQTITAMDSPGSARFSLDPDDELAQSSALARLREALRAAPDDDDDDEEDVDDDDEDNDADDTASARSIALSSPPASGRASPAPAPASRAQDSPLRTRFTGVDLHPPPPSAGVADPWKPLASPGPDPPFRTKFARDERAALAPDSAHTSGSEKEDGDDDGLTEDVDLRDSPRASFAPSLQSASARGSLPASAGLVSPITVPPRATSPPAVLSPVYPPRPEAQSRASVLSMASTASSQKKVRPESMLPEPRGPLVLGIALVDFNHLVRIGPRLSMCETCAYASPKCRLARRSSSPRASSSTTKRSTRSCPSSPSPTAPTSSVPSSPKIPPPSINSPISLAPRP